MKNSMDSLMKEVVSHEKLRGKEHGIILIDGRCASGKTTLAKTLSKALNADVIHMDDFFLPKELRTKERLEEPGGNVDYDRFRTQVIPYLTSSQIFTYQKFDCRTMELGEERRIDPRNYIIVEGSYSFHPKFGNYGDLKIFCDIDGETQMKRIIERNGVTQAKNFKERWIPLEEKYFAAFSIAQSADMYYTSVSK